MRTPQPRMQDVVLEEADDDAAGRAAATGLSRARSDRDARGPRSTRRRWWAAGAVLAIVAVAGAAQSDETGPGLPPGVVGALAPVDRPLAELWRVPARYVSGPTEVDGLLVASLQGADGTADVVGLDPATGTQAWRTRVLDGGPLTGRVTCVTPDAAPDGTQVTACVVVDLVGPVDGYSRPSERRPADARLVLVDPADGTVLHDDVTPASSTLATLGPDLVRSHVDDDGRLHVTRTDATTSVARWTFTSPEPLPATRYGLRAWVTTAGGLVLAGGDTGWVLSADGAMVHTWRPRTAGAGWAEVVADGLLAQPAPVRRGDAGPEHAVAEIVELATGRTFTVPGLPMLTAVDDGSAPGLVLVRERGERVAGYDASTGRAGWSLPDAGTGAALVIGGRVVLSGEDTLTALDAATGETLWSAPVRRVSRVGPVTDGRLVLTGRPDPARGTVLGAYGVEDGRLRWDTDLPDDVRRLRVAAGRLFALTPDSLVALG